MDFLVKPTALALLGYVTWGTFLLLLLAVYRSYLTLAGKRRANNFACDGKDVSEFSHRLCRAHANCYENLPYFCAIVLVAYALEKTNITDPLVYWFLGARVAQGITHLVSTSIVPVLIRFGLFAAQVGILVYWIISFYAAV